MEVILKLIQDPEVALLLIAGLAFATLLITGTLVPKPYYQREVARADKLEAIVEKVTNTLRDVTEGLKDGSEALKDLTAEVRRK